MKTVKMKNEIIKILWKYSMFNKGVINEHSYEDMATEIVDTVAKNLHKPIVSGRSEQLKSFYQFLENKRRIYTSRDCSDEWVKEYEKTL